MKRALFIVSLVILVIEIPMYVKAGKVTQAVTLEEIFSRAHSIRTLSYVSKIRSPAGTTARSSIWIVGNRVKANMGGIKIAQIGDKGYVYSYTEWVEDPGLSINTVLTFLRQAQEAGDTRITGEEVVNDQKTTIVEYTQPQPTWMKPAMQSLIKVKLWISQEHLIPIKILVNNKTQKKKQVEEIISISFEDIDEDAGGMSFGYILESAEKSRRVRQQWKRWQKTFDEEYRKVSRIDRSQQATPKEKVAAWEAFLAAHSENNPHSLRDNQLRAQAHARARYWKHVKPAPPTGSEQGEIGHDRTFVAYENGVVKDTKTGLEWVAGPDKDTSWDEAQSWARSLSVDGGGWRMPKTGELETLYRRHAGKRNMTPLLKTTGWYVWTEKTHGPSAAWSFSFYGGREGWSSRSSSRGLRAFAVRHGK